MRPLDVGYLNTSDLSSLLVNQLHHIGEGARVDHLFFDNPAFPSETFVLRNSYLNGMGLILDLCPYLIENPNWDRTNQLTLEYMKDGDGAFIFRRYEISDFFREGKDILYKRRFIFDSDGKLVKMGLNRYRIGKEVGAKWSSQDFLCTSILEVNLGNESFEWIDFLGNGIKRSGFYLSHGCSLNGSDSEINEVMEIDYPIRTVSRSIAEILFFSRTVDVTPDEILYIESRGIPSDRKIFDLRSMNGKKLPKSIRILSEVVRMMQGTMQ